MAKRKLRTDRADRAPPERALSDDDPTRPATGSADDPDWDELDALEPDPHARIWEPEGLDDEDQEPEPDERDFWIEQDDDRPDR
jgi:hypothetical protein